MSCWSPTLYSATTTTASIMDRTYCRTQQCVCIISIIMYRFRVDSLLLLRLLLLLAVAVLTKMQRYNMYISYVMATHKMKGTVYTLVQDGKKTTQDNDTRGTSKRKHNKQPKLLTRETDKNTQSLSMCIHTHLCREQALYVLCTRGNHLIAHSTIYKDGAHRRQQYHYRLSRGGREGRRKGRVEKETPRLSDKIGLVCRSGP